MNAFACNEKEEKKLINIKKRKRENGTKLTFCLTIQAYTTSRMNEQVVPQKSTPNQFFGSVN
jgi:hypothetical protein